MFPNCHVHKFTKMMNYLSKKERGNAAFSNIRIVSFSLVNPEQYFGFFGPKQIAFMLAIIVHHLLNTSTHVHTALYSLLSKILRQQ